MRIEVDRDFCQGNGICESVSPHTFEVGEDGLAQLRLDVVPPELCDDVMTAVDSCPNAALRVVEG